MARCPSCGAEFDLDVYICDNCGYQMKTEWIEVIPLFHRTDAKIYKPDPMFIRFAKLIYKPAYAFKDINAKKDKNGPRFITFFNGLLIGLWAVAINIHVKISGLPLLMKIIQDVPTFLIFFLFGWIYWSIVFMLYNFVYSLGANFSVQLDGILSIRYNVRQKTNRFLDLLSGKSRLRKITGQEFKQDYTAQKKILTKIAQTGKYRVMNYAYVSFIVMNFLAFLLLLIFLPTVEFPSNDFIVGVMDPIWASFIWKVVDVLQILAVLWSAVLLSIGLREMGNCSTTRILIGNLILALIIAYTTIFLRPTLALNFNLIARIKELFG